MKLVFDKYLEFQNGSELHEIVVFVIYGSMLYPSLFNVIMNTIRCKVNGKEKQPKTLIHADDVGKV